MFWAKRYPPNVAARGSYYSTLPFNHDSPPQLKRNHDIVSIFDISYCACDTPLQQNMHALCGRDLHMQRRWNMPSMPVVVLCLRPTPANNLYILAGIAPPSRGNVSGKLKIKDMTSRTSFLKCEDPLSTSPKCMRIATWKERLSSLPPASYIHGT